MVRLFFLTLLLLVIAVGCTPPPGTKYAGLQSIRRQSSSGRMHRASSSSKDGHSQSMPLSGRRNIIVKTAKSCIGIRYRYGGKDRGGFDCSGLTLFSYNKSGIKLPRRADTQYYKGKKVSIRNARPGDLVFFQTSRRRRISHVGIYLGNSRFVHAPSRGKRVRIDSIQNRYWRRAYIGAATYIN